MKETIKCNGDEGLGLLGAINSVAEGAIFKRQRQRAAQSHFMLKSDAE